MGIRLMSAGNEVLLTAEKSQTTGRRSLEVTRIYFRRGQNVTRSLWVNLSPKNTLLKVLLIPPAVVFTLTLLIFILIFLGFTLLAVALMQAFGKTGAKNQQ
jgi:hypothetical protein